MVDSQAAAPQRPPFPYLKFMLIIVGGLPASGKTTLGKLLAKKLGLELLSPNSLYPKNVKDEGLRQSLAVSAWEVCEEAVDEFTASKDNTDLLILDSIALNHKTLRPMVLNAQTRGHQVLYVLCLTSKETAKRRSKEWIGDDIYNSYLDKLKKSVQSIKSMSDKLIVLRNEDDTYTDIKQCFKEVLSFLNEK